MKKLLLACLILTAPLLGCKWNKVSDIPLPEFKEVLQYDREFKRMVISDHISYAFYVEYVFGHQADITHWMELPDPPEDFEEDALD